MNVGSSPKVLGIVYAGGRGNGMAPLTDRRALGALPFGGTYRLVDFPLSNLVNANVANIVVLTDGTSPSLDRHIAQHWSRRVSGSGWVATTAAEPIADGEHGAALSVADAIYQRLEFLGDQQPEHLVVLSANSVQRIDPEAMLRQHLDTEAGVTVATRTVPVGASANLPVVTATNQGNVTRVGMATAAEKAVASQDDNVWVPTGDYVFHMDALLKLMKESEEPGKDILNRLAERAGAHQYDVSQFQVPGAGPLPYFRGIESIDDYFQAHMDLVAELPAHKLHNPEWPVHGLHQNFPPALLADDSMGDSAQVRRSLLSPGCVVAGGKVTGSVLSPGVYVDSRAEVTDAVLLDNVQVGAGARIRNAIVDKDCVVPPGAYIGWDRQNDSEQFTMSPNGIVVVAKGRNLMSLPRNRSPRLKPAVPSLRNVRV